MASEIRANKQTNRVGLGTVTYTDTGIIVSGIVTANSFKGDGSSLTGIDATALKDGAGNVKVQANNSGINITGVTTTTGYVLSEGTSGRGGIFGKLEIGYDTRYLTVQPLAGNDTLHLNINNGTEVRIGALATKVDLEVNGDIKPKTDGDRDLGLTGTRFRAAYVDTYYGDGSNLTNLPAGAPVGGASTNTVFFENDKAVAVNYQITSTKNAMSAGPIAINAGIAVTVPSGCSWTIV